MTIGAGCSCTKVLNFLQSIGLYKCKEPVGVPWTISVVLWVNLGS